MYIDSLLSSYPRQRLPLPKEYQEIYTKEYEINRKGETTLTKLIQKIEGWMHNQVVQQGNLGSVLEIGGGTLNHLNYETPEKYDVIEPFQALYKDSHNYSLVNKMYADISQIPNNASYDRIISIAVLEHLENLPNIIARSALMLSDNGQAQHAFPSEGGFLWGLGWRFTTGISYRLRTGLSYKTLMHSEHINTSPEIISILRYFFKTVQIFRAPLPFHHFSFYTYVNAKIPFRQRCIDYLQKHSG